MHVLVSKLLSGGKIYFRYDVPLFIFSHDKNIKPWPDGFLDDKLKKRLWVTCTRWSRLDEHFRIFNSEVNETEKKSADVTSEKKSRFFWFF